LYATEGKMEQAEEQAREGLRLNPDNVIAAENVIGFQVALGRFDEARKIYQQTIAHKLDDDTLHTILYGVEFVANNAKGIAEQAAWFENRPELQHEILGMQADTEAYAGHLAKAREITRRAVESALRADNKESAAFWQLTGALREALFGHLEEAKQGATAALALVPDSRDAQQLAAVVLARAGDTARVRNLSAALAKRYPLHSLVQSYWLPTIQAQIALNARDAPGAITQLRNAAALEYGLSISSMNNSCLLPTYLRGEAYLAAGQDGAAAEFQKIIDRPGLVWNCATGALAHL